MIRFFLLQNRAGKTRLAKYYTPFSDDEKARMEDEVYRLTSTRDSKFANFLEVSAAVDTHGAALRRTPRREQRLRLRRPAAAHRSPAALPQYKTYKLVYRRYAGLYFILCVDVTDNELLYLESIHLFVEVRPAAALRTPPACLLFALYAHTSQRPRAPLFPLSHYPPKCSSRITSCLEVQLLDHYFGNVCELDLVFGFHKVYCILDEFIIGGEVQETSKRVILDRLKEINALEG